MSNLQRNRQPTLPLGYTVEGNTLVALSGIDFVRHKHIIGVSGSGKSSFLASCNMFLLRQGIPFMLLDPHGDLAKLDLTLLASSDFFNNPRAYDRLWYVDFARTDSGVAFNVLKQPYEPHTVANNLLEATHRAFPMTGTTASLDNMMLAGTLALVENGKPLTALNNLILDSSFREAMLRNVTDPLVVQFFKSKFTDKVNNSLVDSTLRRSFLLTFSPVLRNTLGQKENKLNFRYILDNNISCIFNLGGLDDVTKRFVGCLLMVGIEQAFLSRANIPDAKRTPMHVFVDEFPLFSASEDSFSVILEQVRKYKGTLYLAHQTTSQLSKGTTGSLQNAISILFRLGHEDSPWAAGRFVRKPQQTGFLDMLLGNTPQPGAFDNVENLQDAKYVFEDLERSEAIVNVNKQALHIRTLTLPQVRVDPRTLAEIENTYARKLLTPLSQIERELAGSNLVVVASEPSSIPVAKRRVASGTAVESQPLQLIIGTLADDLLTALFHLHYATLSQLCKLLGRESSSNHVRTKLNNLKENGMVDSATLARSTSGKPPTVWFLTQSTIKAIADSLGLPVPMASGEKKHGYLEHTLACTDLAVASITLPQVKSEFTLLNFKHERTLKNAAIKISEGVYLVPDGWAHLKLHNEHIGICFELDRNTEEKEKIQQKIQSYVSFASGIYQQSFGLGSLTIAFCVTDGGDRRVKQLVSWSEQILENNKDAASLFLFGSVSPGTVEPDAFFLDTPFHSPLGSSPHTLVEM